MPVPFPAAEYAEAVRRENWVRESAPHGLTENLCGFEVRQMTFLDFLALRLVRSPFLGGEFAPEAKRENRDFLVAAVRQFLWRLSPTYTPKNGMDRARFMRRCRVFLPPLPPLFKTDRALARWAKREVAALAKLGEVLKAIREYVSDTLQDWGASKGKGGITYISNEVEIVGMIAREYKWSRKDILALEMKILLQHVKEIRMANGQKASFNRSDEISFKWLNERNRN